MPSLAGCPTRANFKMKTNLESFIAAKGLFLLKFGARCSLVLSSKKLNIITSTRSCIERIIIDIPDRRCGCMHVPTAASHWFGPDYFRHHFGLITCQAFFLSLSLRQTLITAVQQFFFGLTCWSECLRLQHRLHGRELFAGHLHSVYVVWGKASHTESFPEPPEPAATKLGLAELQAWRQHLRKGT